MQTLDVELEIWLVHADLENWQTTQMPPERSLENIHLTWN